MKHADVVRWLEVKNVSGDSQSTLVVDYTNRIEERKRKIIARQKVIRELGKSGGKTLTTVELETVVICRREIADLSMEIRTLRGSILRVKGEDAKYKRRRTQQAPEKEVSERTPVDRVQLPSDERKTV